MKNSLSKLGFCAFIVCLLASRGMATPLLNPGFELGLSSWDHDSNTYPIGTSGQPIGTGGKSAANLGTFDQVGSYVSQRVCVVPGLSYSLTLSIGANGAGVAGRIASVRCFVVANGGQVVLDRNFAVASVGAAQGGLGFQRITTSFSVPLDTIEILLQFSDASPAQGKGVDLMLDDVGLEEIPVSPPLATTIVPPAVSVTEGDGGLAGYAGRIRLQEIYSSALLPTRPIIVREIRFRPDAVYGVGPFAGTLSQISFTLSSSPKAPGSLSYSFESNHGPDKQVVFSGPWTVATAQAGPITGPKAFDVRLPLQTPFRYDPSKGNLLIDYRNYSSLAKRFTTDAVNGPGLQVIFDDGNPDSFTAKSSAPAADAIELVYSLDESDPVFFVQPAGRQLFQGSPLELFVSAVGSPPLLYQWYKNDTELPTATEPKFQIPSVQPTDSGNYSVVVSNKNGSVTSEKAVIQVVPIPEAEMVIPPSFATVEANGATANLSVRSREQTIYDKSLFGPNPIVITHLRFRQDRTISGIPEGLSAMVSNLQVRLSTSARPTGSMSGTFSENTGSDEKLCFQGDWAIYTKGINPPSGVPEPFDLILYLQQPFSYDPALGNLLLDMKNPTLAKIFVGLDAGTVQGLVQRRFVEDPNGLTSGGGDSSGPVIKLGYSLARIAPRIHTQPVAVNSMQTSNATFMVFASGYAPLGYQWYQDANPVPGATSPTLNFQNLLLSQAGSYSVVVSNEFGQAVSQPVILTVVPRPPRRALATAQIVNGYLVGITLLDGGFGYTNPPLVKIVGGGGSGAAANAIVNNGVVIGFEVLDVGKGYTGSTSIRVASPPRLPTLAIKVKTVTVGLKLNMGKSYQLQSSRDLTTWSPLGQVFVADEDEMSLDFNVSESGQYFRVDELP